MKDILYFFLQSGQVSFVPLFFCLCVFQRLTRHPSKICSPYRTIISVSLVWNEVGTEMQTPLIQWCFLKCLNVSDTLESFTNDIDWTHILTFLIYSWLPISRLIRWPSETLLKSPTVHVRSCHYWWRLDKPRRWEGGRVGTTPNHRDGEGVRCVTTNSCLFATQPKSFFSS